MKVAAARVAAILGLVAASGAVFAADSGDDLAALKAKVAELEKRDQALQSRVVELEGKEDANWMTQQRADQIRAIVEETLADAKKRGQYADGPTVGYNNGFFIQTPDNNFKLVVGGLLQVRYEYALHQADDSKFKTKPLAQGDRENSSGFDIRRARLNFTGNAFSPNLFYRFEGDFYGSSTGGFTVTDAYGGYAFSDAIKLRAGAFKTPFTKAEQEYDANLELERSEVNFPFDPQRSLGFSSLGEPIKDHLGYEVNANDGAKSNTFRYVDTNNNVTTVSTTSTPSYNLDNRLSFYSRVQYASSDGTIKEFYEGGEADLRKGDRPFIWLLGGAVGYESQNSSGAAFAQNTVTVPGAGSNDSPGYQKAYVLNGDLYRATLDWSAKWKGLSVNTAAYFQQVNANPFSGSTTAGLPYNVNKASFFQQGYSAQVGYMVIPQRLEVVGRYGILLDEGDPNLAEYYTLGANYYLYGNNAKILADVNYTPETAYTDAATLQIANTKEVVFRLQLQLKF
jgi:hypothetical protein